MIVPRVFNRLWIRLALGFGAMLVIFGGVILITATLLRLPHSDERDELRLPRSEEPRYESDSAGPVQAGPQEDWSQDKFESEMDRISRGLFVVGLLGMGVGVTGALVLSRSLARPLEELAGAARALGQRQLDHRVRPRGSVEMIAVAESFNHMAEELGHAEQLRRALIADVSHELRTPLTVLQGNLRAILDDVYQMDKEEVARLFDQTRHLTRLVEDLHDLSRADANQLELTFVETDLRARLEQVAAIFAPVAEEEGVTLLTELSEGLPPARTDPVRMTQVFHNLLSNALRHTARAGQIRLRLSRQGDLAEIAIQDSGAGIAAGDLPLVFDRFYRADKSRTRGTGGTGLGLAIAKAIVQAHGGSIHAESAGLGQGATFIIRLPLAGPGRG